MRAALLFVLLTSLSLHPQVRHKPGPVYLRGVASRVSRSSFLLQTTHHGTYQVVVSSATSITEKGKRVALQSDDHVGVHGFLSGRTLRAIYVHIYPSKPKPFSLKGVVTRASGAMLDVRTGNATTSVLITSTTTILIGSAEGKPGQIRVGDRVDVRAEHMNGQTVAIHIHVYRHKVAGVHVQIKGIVTGITSGAVTVRSGAVTYRVQIVSSTIFYVGAGHGSVQNLQTGETVRVYACCQGQPLIARSVHIEKSATHRASLLLRGVVAGIGPASLTLDPGRRLIQLRPSTVYEVGLTHATRSGVFTGDHVSVRVVRQSGALVALRVHVYVSFRRPRTVIGTVLEVGEGRLTVLERGRHFTIVPAPHAAVTLNGKRSSMASIKRGDHVHATGNLDGSTLTATVVAVRRSPPAMHTIHGVLATIHGSFLTVRDGSGVSHGVRLEQGVRPLWHGHIAPASALFVGVHVSVRGVLQGRVLIASRLTITVTAAAASGRILSAGGKQLLLDRRHVHVVLPPAIVIRDGNRSLGSSGLRVGAYIRVSGYSLGASRIRATRVVVAHPVLDLSGVVAVDHGLSLRTSAGEKYTVALASGVSPVSQRVALPVSVDEIPDGARVHVHGTMQTSGVLLADTITVALASVSLRTTVAALSSTNLALSSGERAVVIGETTITQGSHSLALLDLVVGDDVTVEGYRARDEILAHHILVHRALVGLDGVIAAVQAGGFLLTSGGQQIQVVVPADAVVTVQLTVGIKAHVTGYRRGDGSILATRVHG